MPSAVWGGVQGEILFRPPATALVPSSSATLLYCSTCGSLTGEMRFDLKPPASSSPAKDDPKSPVRPSRSRTVLLYWMRVSRRSGVRPGVSAAAPGAGGGAPGVPGMGFDGCVPVMPDPGGRPPLLPPLLGSGFEPEGDPPTVPVHPYRNVAAATRTRVRSRRVMQQTSRAAAGTTKRNEDRTEVK